MPAVNTLPRRIRIAVIRPRIRVSHILILSMTLSTLIVYMAIQYVMVHKFPDNPRKPQKKEAISVTMEPPPPPEPEKKETPAPAPPKLPPPAKPEKPDKKAAFTKPAHAKTPPPAADAKQATAGPAPSSTKAPGRPKTIDTGKVVAYTQAGRALAGTGKSLPAVEIQAKDVAPYIHYIEDRGGKLFLKTPSGKLACMVQARTGQSIPYTDAQRADCSSAYRILGTFGEDKDIDALITRAVSQSPTISFAYEMELIYLWHRDFAYQMMGQIDEAAKARGISIHDIVSVTAAFDGRRIVIENFIKKNGQTVTPIGVVIH